jgi:hypothetical protein
MDKVNNIVIYLTSWQKRMVAEYLPGLKSPKRVVIPGKIDPGSLVKYKPFDPGSIVKYRPYDHVVPNDMSWRLYLTDSQIERLIEEGGHGPGISAILVNSHILESGQVKFE